MTSFNVLDYSNNSLLAEASYADLRWITSSSTPEELKNPVIKSYVGMFIQLKGYKEQGEFMSIAQPKDLKQKLAT